MDFHCLTDRVVFEGTVSVLQYFRSQGRGKQKMSAADRASQRCGAVYVCVWGGGAGDFLCLTDREAFEGRVNVSQPFRSQGRCKM